MGDVRGFSLVRPRPRQGPIAVWSQVVLDTAGFVSNPEEGELAWLCWAGVTPQASIEGHVIGIVSEQLVGKCLRGAGVLELVCCCRNKGERNYSLGAAKAIKGLMKS